MQRGKAFLALALTSALLMGGCGPGGVSVVDDWAGSDVLALATVNDQRVVIGVNTAERRSNSLVVLPSREDDDKLLAPSIARLGSGRTVLSVPRTGGKASRLYSIDGAGQTLTGVGELENGRSLLAAGELLAGVAGDQRKTVVLSPQTWKITGEVAAVSANGYVAGSQDQPILCIGSDTTDGLRSESLALPGGSVVTSSELGNTSLLAIACAGKQPVAIVAGPAADADRVTVTASLPRGKAGVITVSGGNTVRTFIGGSHVAVAVSGNKGTTLLELSADGSREQRRVVIDGFTTAVGLYHVRDGYLLVNQEKAAFVAPGATSADVFPLAGTLLSAP